MLTAVTFDFWQTLFNDPPENLARGREMRLRALADVLRGAGCAFPPSAIEDAYERCGTEMIARFWKADRDLGIRDQLRLLFECLDPGLGGRLAAADLERAVAGYVAPALALPPDLVPGADEAVRRVAEHGVRLGLVSNTGRTPGVVLSRVLERHDLLRHFAVLTYSDEVGFRKPHPVVFARTLTALGALPGDAVHVGDNPHDDVLGARRSGMRAAHYAAAGKPPAPDADVVVTHLAELPERLLAVR